MPQHRNAIVQFEALQRLSRAKLQTLWTKELSEAPPSSLGRDILALGIAYAQQERLYGGLSPRVVKELERLGVCAMSNGAEAQLSTNPIPRAGTILVRESDDGFLWNGNQDSTWEWRKYTYPQIPMRALKRSGAGRLNPYAMTTQIDCGYQILARSGRPPRQPAERHFW
jgi:hypothetical protein